MSKVKQRAVLTGVRNVKAGKATTRTSAARASTTAPVRAAKKVVAKGARTVAKKGLNKASKAVAKAAPTRPVRGRKRMPAKTKTPAPKVAKKVTIAVAPARGGRAGRLEPIARYAIKPLDPLRKCGPGTSVQFLYRVEESVEGKRTTHLVFFDRHGWYCEHGRTCPAVAPARKFNGHIARGA